jgi:hypothetical protein
MTVFERLRYSFYLTAVGAAAIVLAISILSADVVGGRPVSADKLAYSPSLLFPLYLRAYLAAPWVSRRFPIGRKREL